MQINDLSARVKASNRELKEAAARVIDSGWFVMGQELQRFEAAFAEYLEVAYCMGVANGTDAIELGLKAIGVQAGDRVATVANAGLYTTSAILAIGAEPVFMDVDLDSQNVTLDEVVRALRTGAKAIVVTHIYGRAVADIVAIAKMCAEQGVQLLEDCAQAHGAMIGRRRVGSFGDAASFSFYPTKNLGALGDGGALVTNRADVAERVARLRQYGWIRKYEVGIPGGRNSRLDEMQAAILSVFLPHLDKKNSMRRKISIRYRNEIKNPAVLLPPAGGEESVAHLYVVRSLRRDSLRDHLKALQISSEVHYPIPDYCQPIFGGRFSLIQLKNTEKLASEILTLPCYPEMSDDDVSRVVFGVNSWE